MGKRLLLMVTLALMLFLTILFSPLLYGKRGLTEKELAVGKAIYASSINFDNVRIKTGGPLTLVYPGITIGNTISFPKGAYDENDEKDQALLVHELCHVWQYQHFGLGYIPRSIWELGTERDTYVLHFDPAKKFRDYDIEEQCEMTAEYFLSGDSKYLPYIETLRNY